MNFFGFYDTVPITLASCYACLHFV